MKIIGIGPEENCPFIPQYLLNDSNEVITKLRIKPVGQIETVSICPTEIDDNEWILIERNQQISKYIIENEKQFLAEKVSKFLEESQIIKNPIEKGKFLNAFSKIIGISIPDLFRHLDSLKKNPNEPLENLIKKLDLSLK